MEFDKIHLYRMIHIDNIPHVTLYGITHKNSPNCNPNFIPIGDVSLIGTRNITRVNVDNGDLENPNPQNILLGEFIPFYFGVKMPMLFVVQNGGNFVEKRTPPEDIVYMACSLRSITNQGIEYYFTDGHATDSLTTFYNNTRENDIPGIINWEAIKQGYWAGQENLNTKRKKQAEFLVKSDLPVDIIKGFGCYNEAAKEKLINMGILEDNIKIIPNSYF